MGEVSANLSLLLLQCSHPTLVLSSPKPGLNSSATRRAKEEKAVIIVYEIRVKSGWGSRM